MQRPGLFSWLSTAGRLVQCPAVLCAVLLATSCLAHGQMLGDPAGPQAQPAAPVVPPPPAYAPPPPPLPIPTAQPPLNFDALMASAFSESSFTFDRSMLQAADGFFAGGDPDTRRVLAGLNSITVHNYRARDFARYDSGALSAIDGTLRGAGWRHLVNANPRNGGPMTDLWLRYEGANITNVTVVSRGDRNMSVVAVDCTLRPLDLLHLSGHFGIPKVDENAITVPAH